ncbi:MAG TPA: hypothetical protein VLV48_07390 [Thermoanaerobaculia bacterium]|nr:hypothetical protein [Thermoanaerobaculia bacterium]
MTAGYTKEEWATKLEAMSDDDLRRACNQYIWLSAYAHNNSRSAYHWMCDATYDECHRRDKDAIYSEEHEKLTRQARGC